ncbi:TPA: glycosyltransferase family 25 protein [Pasteurella multocida]|nr:glycosyltransferase family 25 protein [Pasteurella multocida]
MQKWLISLEKDHARREYFFAQPDTADFTVFSAMNTMQESWENLTALFDLNRFQQYYGRAVTKGEVGCTLSHLAVYQQIVGDATISENDYCLVCEDDVLFNQGFQRHLETLLTQKPQADVILVGQSKIDHFEASELEINYPTTFACCAKKIAHSSFYYAYPYKNYFAGTVAYLIKKSAARVFIEQSQQGQRPFWLADDFILFGRDFCLDIMVVRPLLAIENPALVSNLEASRGSVSHHLWQKWLKYPLKKWLAIQRNFQIKG